VTASSTSARPAPGSVDTPPPGDARRPQLLAALPAALLLFALGVAVAQAWRWSHEVPTWHMDGAFQTASGLYRLADGQWPGRDFFPYLGIAPVLVLYPVFALLGGELTDTVFAARLVALLTMEAVVGVLAVLVAGRRPLRALAWGAASAALLVVAAALVWPGLWTAADGVLGVAAVPGNSLRPIRAFAPYLLAAVAYGALRSGWTVRRAAVVGTAAGAVAALWSNDYGPVSGALVLAVVTSQVLRAGWGPRLRGLAALWGAAGAGYLLAGLTATAGHLPALLAYNLSDVRNDQFWYFGPWTEPSRVFSVGDLLRIMAGEGALYPLAVLAGVVVYALVRRGLGSLLVTYLGTATLLGGLIATVGGHAAGYSWAFVWWGYVVSVVGAVRLVALAAGRVPVLGTRGAALRPAAVAVTVAVLAVAGAAAVQDARQAGGVLAADPRYVYDPGLGGFLDAAFQQQVQTARESDAPVVEEYLGLSGVVDGPPSSSVDSVIAALGGQREAFAARLADRPELVVTTAPEVTDWVTWNLSANWWFYRDLFQGFAPVRTSPLTLTWTPAAPATWAEVQCRTEGAQVVVEAPSAGLYEVTLYYRGPGRGARAFTMVQNDVNIAEDAGGFVALDPGARVQRFPVAVRDPGSGTTVLATRDVPADDGPLTVLESCSASSISFPEGADTAAVYGRLLAPAPAPPSDGG
jgi:hypothetical protein